MLQYVTNRLNRFHVRCVDQDFPSAQSCAEILSTQGDSSLRGASSINHAYLGNLEYWDGKWSQPRGSPDSIRGQNIFDPHRQAPQEANGVDLRFIPEPIRSLVCYLGPLRVAGKMSLISID